MTLTELLNQPMPVRHNGHLINIREEKGFWKTHLILANGNEELGDYACQRPDSVAALREDLQLFTGLVIEGF